ncbi:MAG: DUF362 domain-containing protein [Deltaproteobacteria bacterium]|nr:DUF362 domain-containing protein [Deltaproteobacteria bacterium]MBF0527529.1 DUF362 domain-containing protein [Deltaproteobacteria bacterium]
MPRVMVRKAEYDYAVLKPIIFEMLQAFDQGRIKANTQVLIKPNLLFPTSPETAILTHPLIIKAAAEYVLEKGGRVSISDSGAIGAFEKALKLNGITKALEGLPVVLKEFKNSVRVSVGEPFGEIELAEDAVAAEVIINLPKLKTHSQMMLTLGVKNMFGCVVGFRKPEWHLRAGVSREKFAHLLVAICSALKPTVTILDGILALEGEGPGKGGQPRHLGLIIAGDDTLAVDVTVCRLLGLEPLELLTSKVAHGLGLLDPAIELEGELPRIKGFRLPATIPLLFGPRIFHGFLRKNLIQRPVAQSARCKLCGECWQYCPAKAISHDRRKVTFDYDKCIRCYCCIEVCPHAALTTNEPLPGKIIRKMLKIYS